MRLSKLREHDARSPEVWFRLGSQLFCLGRYELAHRAVERLLSLGPFKSHHIQLAYQSYWKRGDRRFAIKLVKAMQGPAA